MTSRSKKKLNSIWGSLIMSPSSLPEENFAEDSPPLAVIPDAPVGEDDEEEHFEEVASWKRRPWWKRPSPYWIVFGVPVSSLGYSASFPTRVEVYTQLTCRVHKPEYFPDSHSTQLLSPLVYDVAPAALDFTDNRATVDNHTYLFIPNAADISTTGFVEDKETRQKCASDPEVQAAAARLSATLVTSMGILSCLVTGFWGPLCDRYGRRPVLAVSMLGLLLTDLTFIITANFVDHLPGGYWFLLTGFIIEGLFGSMPTGVAANHAYMADTTEPSLRSRLFSFSLGLMFAGFAIGPLVGGLIMHLTGSTLSVFFLSATLHFIYGLFIVFVLPESLTNARAHRAHIRYKEEMAKSANTPVVMRVLKNATTFLSALTVLFPRDAVDGNPLKRPRKDWNLFLLCVCYALSTSLVSSLPFIFQYAVATFSWTAETTNYFFSSMGVTRTVTLTILLPLLIKLLTPTKPHALSAVDELHRDAPAHELRSPLRSRSPTRHGSQTRTPVQLPSHSPHVDLFLGRCALSVEIVALCIMATATSGTVFAIGTMIGSVSVAFSPLAQALALEIYGATGKKPAQRGGRGDVGRLFGAMSVLQALGSQIIGPAAYGFVYSRTVATFPQAIMLVSVFTFTVAFTLLAFVRISVPSANPSPPPSDAEEGEDEIDGTGEGVPEGVLIDVAEGQRRE
ncbi:hypothetical protein ID866_8658 [Astraeus odoratus]|nr:hypothetical protein ID866_8658 [Astraeus odoratus]